MAKFDIQYADRPVNVQATSAPMQAATGEFQAISQVGQAIFQIGSQLQQRKNALDLSEGQRRIDEQVNSAVESMTGDEKSDMEIWNKLQEDIAGVQYGSGKVDSSLEIYRNNLLPNAQKAITKRHKALVQQNIHDQFEAEGQTYLAKGDMLGYQSILDRRLATKDISQAEYESLSKSALTDSKIQQSRDFIASGDVGKNQAATVMLDSIPDEELKTVQKEYIQKLKSMSRKNMQIMSDEANKELTDIMLSGEMTAQDVMMRRDRLDDEDYKSWAKISLSPVDKAPNVIAASALNSKSLDIWRGTTSKQDFDKELRASLEDPNGINNEQYAAIVKNADTQLKATQSEGIRRHSRDAANVILGQYSGLLTFDPLGNLTGVNMAGLNKDQTEDLKYRFHYLSLYQQEIRDYIADNPEASGKEFYQFASSKKVEYWQTPLEDMKAAAFGGQTEGKSAVTTAEELRRQGTEEAYNRGVQLGYWK